MNDFNQRVTVVKSALDQQKVAEILSYIGYEINRNYQFKLRLEENTPSVSIRRDGYIKDFGSGWGGDIITLLQDYKQVSFLEALSYLEDCLGVSYE